jgi:DNA-binding NtrC family response regulator
MKPYREAIHSPLDMIMHEAGREYCRRVLAQTGGNVTAAAKIAGYTRSSFSDVLRRYGLKGAGKGGFYWQPTRSVGNPASH